MHCQYFINNAMDRAGSNGKRKTPGQALHQIWNTIKDRLFVTEKLDQSIFLEYG